MTQSEMVCVFGISMDIKLPTAEQESAKSDARPIGGVGESAKTVSALLKGPAHPILAALGTDDKIDTIYTMDQTVPAQWVSGPQSTAFQTC
jgi:hypothetical protein